MKLKLDDKTFAALCILGFIYNMAQDVAIACKLAHVINADWYTVLCPSVFVIAFSLTKIALRILEKED